jgi:hypothetical protein
MIQVQVINKIKFPDITPQSVLEDIARIIIIPDIERGIDAGKAITGGALPRNEPATIKRKGGRDTPLIDTGELRRSFYYKTSGKNRVIITIENIRKAIGGYLQNDGVGKKNKHYLFFGISSYAAETAMAYVKKRIEEQLNARRTR